MAATILITGASGFIGFRILLDSLAAGHKVFFAVRSEDKAQIILSNPAVKKLAPGDRLLPIVIPDCTLADAFDDALKDKDVTHIIHVGSPVTNPKFDPKTEIFEPTVKSSANLLAAALKAASVQRIIITSSTVANIGLVPPSSIPSATTSGVLPDFIPSFSNVQEAYVLGKMVELKASEDFTKNQKPHFTISHIFPGYVFGRNELILDVTQMRTNNSSNTYFMLGMVGGELPFPLAGSFAHIDDVSKLHLQAAFLDPTSSEISKNWGISTEVDFSTIFGSIEKAFPKAVADDIFSKGKIDTFAAPYDCDDTKRFLGSPLKTFEMAAVDVAAQYLELLGRDKA
ncbi:unnamed protein product [Clonostachys rosea f. rosea IK726]|jgi:nucleoside-diphosphate-sugar epimerase|uniref:Uncharacterized protein n=2 Tax=Clonostachys rosea f. rosea IK726 TaxID=1349383 RepID=A0ACA9U7S2_BIOOC|nr:unnamed protein product [Clonostachys rosea f. rosea IK726]CAG9949361.1 unnamed protein product [Clonostachys rosea f. rosea IK726]